MPARVKQVALARSLADAYLIKHVLDEGGIFASVRGEDLVGVAGETPETAPSVWVAEPDAARAAELLRQARRGRLASGLDAMVLIEDAMLPAERQRDVHATDRARQEAMGELFVAADRLASVPRRGEDIDVVYRLGASVAESQPPFGVDDATWDTIAGLTVAVVNSAAAEDFDGVRNGATALRDFLRPYI